MLSVLPVSAKLADGQRVIVREIERHDRALVEEGFRHLSQRSRFLRFLGMKQTLTESELERLTDPTDLDDIALGAVAAGGPGGRGLPVGIARFIRFGPFRTNAEFALTVVDSFQERGAGTLLIETLARVAEGCGVTEFTALVHRENHAMRALGARYGGTETRLDGTELELRIGVSAVVASADARANEKGLAK